MSLDQRLRAALDRASTHVAPDVERSLHRVQGRRRRRVVVRRVAVAVAAAGLAIVLPLAARPLIDGSGPPNIAAAPAERLAGDYEVMLTEADSGGLAPSPAGVWRMRLNADGSLELHAPPTFAGEQSTTGMSFTADETTLRTNAFYSDFCSSLGTYRWQLTGAQLVLEVRDDPCQIRRVLLATRPWTRTG
jgi:hypothetical protein